MTHLLLSSKAGGFQAIEDILEYHKTAVLSNVAIEEQRGSPSNRVFEICGNFERQSRAFSVFAKGHDIAYFISKTANISIDKAKTLLDKSAVIRLNDQLFTDGQIYCKGNYIQISFWIPTVLTRNYQEWQAYSKQNGQKSYGEWTRRVYSTSHASGLYILEDYAGDRPSASSSFAVFTIYGNLEKIDTRSFDPLVRDTIRRVFLPQAWVGGDFSPEKVIDRARGFGYHYAVSELSDQLIAKIKSGNAETGTFRPMTQNALADLYHTCKCHSSNFQIDYTTTRVVHADFQNPNKPSPKERFIWLVSQCVRCGGNVLHGARMSDGRSTGLALLEEAFDSLGTKNDLRSKSVPFLRRLAKSAGIDVPDRN